MEPQAQQTATTKSFNRTFMELRLSETKFNLLKAIRVLIVPLWN